MIEYSKEFWDKFQKEQNEWQESNFGKEEGSSRCLLGMTEELGELAGAKNAEQLKDAVGDVLIYMAGYAFDNDYKLSEILAPEFMDLNSDYFSVSPAILLLKDIGDLSHCHLKNDQGIRLDEDHRGNAKKAMARLIFTMQRCVHACGLKMSVEDITNEVWTNIVSKRDWKANAVDGTTKL